MKLNTKSDFPRALRTLRKAKRLPQEAFDQVSSRTYVSALERGIQEPTIGKIEQLSGVMNAHPLALLTLAYCTNGSLIEIDQLLARVKDELCQLGDVSFNK